MRSFLLLTLLSGSCAFSLSGGAGLLARRAGHAPIGGGRPSSSHLRPSSRISRRRSVLVASTVEQADTETGRPLLGPRVGEVAWKDDFPQRNGRKGTERYINQFPNTWEAAESIVLSKRGKNTDDEGEDISIQGIKFKVASPKKVYDTCVVGTGPAGLVLAAELAANGASVCLLGPVKGGWPNNYGVWMDEWADLNLPDYCIEEVYDVTRITISGDKSIAIPRPYGKVSGPKTRQYLLEKCASFNVEVRETIVEGINHQLGEDRMDPALIECNDESMMQAKVPIVAAGHYSPLVKYSSPGVEWVASEGEYMTRTWDPLLMTPPSQRMALSRGVGEKPSIPVQKQDWRASVERDSVRPAQHAWGWNWGWNPILRGVKIPEWFPVLKGWEQAGGGAPGYQIAYGVTVECSEPHGFPVGEMLLMDFSTDHLGGEGEEEGHVPTFLYAFPFDEKKVFIEETHLVARNRAAAAQSLEMEEMVRRLDLRIEHLGLKVTKRYEEECSVIPMGGPLPVLGQPTLAYGAAAVMVHPASGYMINRVFKYAPEVASAVAKTLKDTGSPQLATEAGWEAVWPKHRLIERDLYCFGMEVMLSLDVELLREFFTAFFANPKEMWWRKFLAWDMTKPGQKPYSMSVFMILMFFRGSLRLKGRLMREAMFKDGVHLLKSIFDMPFPFD